MPIFQKARSWRRGFFEGARTDKTWKFGLDSVGKLQLMDDAIFESLERPHHTLRWRESL